MYDVLPITEKYLWYQDGGIRNRFGITETITAIFCKKTLTWLSAPQPLKPLYPPPHYFGPQKARFSNHVFRCSSILGFLVFAPVWNCDDESLSIESKLIRGRSFDVTRASRLRRRAGPENVLIVAELFVTSREFLKHVTNSKMTADFAFLQHTKTEL